MTNNRRQASTVLLLVLLLPVVLAISAYSINVVYMELARTQLQVNTDIAARAAGRALAVTGDESQATAAANRILSLNKFVNQTMHLADGDLVFGVSTRTSATQRYAFAPSGKPNAVKFEARSKVDVPMLFPTLGMPVEFRPLKQAISTQTELDIVLVVDRSGSMAFGSHEVSGNHTPMAAPAGWQFGDPVPMYSRWSDAVQSIDSLAAYLSSTVHNEKLGLVTYANTAASDQSLTSTYSLIQSNLQNYSLQFYGGATNMGDGLLRGAAALGDRSHARPWASRMLILLTDGLGSSAIDPIVAARTVAANDILIYTVTFAREADQGRMAQIAAIGGGRHFHVTNGTELTAAFMSIAKNLPTLLTH